MIEVSPADREVLEHRWAFHRHRDRGSNSIVMAGGEEWTFYDLDKHQ
jgi:hypothetical protein